MRMRSLLVHVLPLVLLLSTLPGAVASAQDANKIIDQYLKAEGGRKALSKVQTLTLQGTFPNADGAPGTFTLYLKSPNRYYCEIVTGTQPLIEAYNGKSAWQQDASGVVATLLGKDSAELEAASQYYNSRLLDLKKAKIAAAYVGHAEVHGKDALQVELTSVNGLKRELFFDAQSHLLAKESGQRNGQSQEIFYADYRPENGITLPHAMELHRGTAQYQITLSRAITNAPVEERVFDFPRKSQVQLPDLKALFEEIDQNQKAIDKLKENYAGTRVEDETEFESDGRVKKHERKEFTFFFLNGDEISTLVKKDGQPLSAEEQKKENDETQARIRAAQKREAKKESKEEKDKEQGKDSDDPGIELFSARFTICKSATRTFPRAGRAGLRFRAESGFQGAQTGRESGSKTGRGGVDR